MDFVSQAIQGARIRAEQAGVSERVTFYHTSVTQLDFLEDQYDLALDVGCAHGLNAPELRDYYHQLVRLLKPGGFFLLFAHLNEENGDTEDQKWMDEALLNEVFTNRFVLEKVEHGQTQVNDQDPWRSAWFWFRKEDR